MLKKKNPDRYTWPWMSLMCISQGATDCMIFVWNQWGETNRTETNMHLSFHHQCTPIFPWTFTHWEPIKKKGSCVGYPSKHIFPCYTCKNTKQCFSSKSLLLISSFSDKPLSAFLDSESWWQAARGPASQVLTVVLCKYWHNLVG